MPFERELFQLKSKYQTTRFEGLFRETKTDVYQQNFNQASAPAVYQPQVSHQSPTMPTRTISASPANGSRTNPPASTWATTAMAAPEFVPWSSPTPKPSAPVTKQVQRNRYGQRVDPPLKYDTNEVNRIKKLKLCSLHHLRNSCQNDPCVHDHYYKLNNNELTTLRYISRIVPCRFGSECDDIQCIYGHVCPNSTEGRKDCRYGDSCRYDREQHGVEQTVVKLTKV